MARTPNPAEIRQYMQRAQKVEKCVGAVKLFAIVSIFIVLWKPMAGSNQGAIFRCLLLLYALCNLIYWLNLIFGGKRFLTDWLFLKAMVFFVALMDNLFLAYLLYFSSDAVRARAMWISTGLIIRNTLLFPDLKDLTILNTTLFLFYLGAIVLQQDMTHVQSNIDAIILRVLVLVLFSSTCWGINHIPERRKMIIDEDREEKTRVSHQQNW